jgi:hypothetical protein
MVKGKGSRGKGSTPIASSAGRVLRSLLPVQTVEETVKNANAVKAVENSNAASTYLEKFRAKGRSLKGPCSNALEFDLLVLDDLFNKSRIRLTSTRLLLCPGGKRSSGKTQLDSSPREKVPVQKYSSCRDVVWTPGPDVHTDVVIKAMPLN